MDPDTDVCQTEQPQISYSVDFTAEQSSAMGSPILLDREGSKKARYYDPTTNPSVMSYSLVGQR